MQMILNNTTDFGVIFTLLALFDVLYFSFCIMSKSADTEPEDLIKTLHY